MLSQNPAEIVKLKNIGALKKGNRADFLLFDRKELHLKKTFIAGKIVFDEIVKKIFIFYFLFFYFLFFIFIIFILYFFTFF